MIVKRTEQIWLKPDKNLSCLCHLSKNLYNEANYLIRQEFIKTGRWIRYTELYKLLKNSDNYKQLPAQANQQTLKLLDKSWKSFFNSMKEWKIDKKRFLGRPKLPGYKKKDGELILIFTNQICTVRNSFIKFPKKANIDDVKTRLCDNTDLREVRLIPKGVGYILEIVYNKEIPDMSKKRTKKKAMGIDIGLRNLATIVDTEGNRPICIKGGTIKSINQYYNKKLARMKAKAKKTNNRYITKNIYRLNNKRYKKLKDYMHKASRFIVNLAKERDIDTIVIGHNKNWKQKINIGKRNNQNFVQIPIQMLAKQLQYKAEEYGIQTIEQEESYTSKCSFLDNESIEYHDKYEGRRTSRGLFKSKKGIIINADVNAGYNIIRKAFSKIRIKKPDIRDRGYVVYPLVVKDFQSFSMTATID